MSTVDWRLIAESVPWFVRSAFHVFSRQGELAAVLAERGVRTTCIGAVDAVGKAKSPARAGPFDCIVFTPSYEEIHVLFEAVRGVEPFLDANGIMLFYLPDDADRDGLVSRLRELGLREYEARGPRPATRYTIIEKFLKSEDPTGGKGLMAVRAGYDPIGHAQALFDAGHPEWCFQILDLVPAEILEDPIIQLMVALHMQMSLLAWKADLPPRSIIERFYWAQQQYYRILNLRTQLPTPHICQAAFWQMIGDNGMARRLLRSVHHAFPEPSIARRLAAIPPGEISYEYDEAVPLWDETFRPRILIITHVNSDCGLDVLYDGLCRVLGADRVVEFPWKHFFHGYPIDPTVRHPTWCNHPGDPKSVETLEKELKEGLFDLIVFADTLELSDKADTVRLVHANPRIPLFLADTQDEGFDNLPRILDYLGRDSVCGHFKREMLACVRYAPNTYPLSLAYTDDRVLEDISGERPQDVFWGGHRCWGLRRIYLDFLEPKLGRTFVDLCPPEEFVRQLDRSLIGLDIYGLGYDTMRYWEIPAHGCMLLAERRPIRIPFNYRDGESAVFFDDLPDLEEKLNHYLAHPDEARAIAVKGHEHLRKYHTSSARARQFLGRVQEAL